MYDILTYPLQCKPYDPNVYSSLERVSSIWNKFSLDILRLIQKRHFSALIEKKIKVYGDVSALSTENVMNTWGIPAFTLARIHDVPLNGHPLLLSQMKASMTLLNLKLQIDNAFGDLDEITNILEEYDQMTYIPDPTVSSYRQKHRKRIAIKSTRITEIKRYLEKGLPDSIASGSIANAGE